MSRRVFSLCFMVLINIAGNSVFPIIFEPI